MKFIGPYLIPDEAMPRRVTMADIQFKVAHFYGLPLAEMTSQRRSRNVAWPRQAAMYLASLHTPATYAMIGRRFGDRDHTTVIHAIRSVEARRARSPEYDQQIRDAERLL